jgi:hypothetical protein
MIKLDGIVVPAIMGLVLLVGVFAAIKFTNSAEPVAEAEPPRFTGVLKPQDTVRLRTETAVTTGEETTRGFMQAPAGE